MKSIHIRDIDIETLNRIKRLPDGPENDELSLVTVETG